MRRATSILAVASILLAGACGDDGATTDTVAGVSTTGGDDASPTTPGSRPVSTGGTAPATAGTQPSATGDEEVAIADLAERTGADRTDIVTVSVDNVTWPNSAVGCPQKGMSYLQVLTDGVRIVLEVDGTRYQYHAGGGRPVFYCPRPEVPVGE